MLSAYRTPSQWQRGSALKTGRPDVQGPNPEHACRLSRSEFSVVFSETPVMYDLESLRKTTTEVASTVDPGAKCRQMALCLQPNPSQHL